MVEFRFHNEAGKAYPNRQTAASCVAAIAKSPSLPFEFAIGGDDVARTVLIEQFPPRLFASSGLRGYPRQGRSLHDEAADIPNEILEVAALVGDRTAPIGDDRA